MKLIQFHLPGQGTRAGLLDGDSVTDITCSECSSVLALVETAAARGRSLDEVAETCPRGQVYSYKSLDCAPDAEVAHLLPPVDAPEVWGCGVTYLRSAAMRDEDSVQDIYSRVYNSNRPEIFFKSTPARSVGPNGDVGCRVDSQLTACEPELAFLLGRPDQILGYTICNDVSAWDLERDNPLYLPQSKTFLGCCALGPCIATSTSLPEPANLDISCQILRGAEVIYEGHVNSSQMKYDFATLASFLSRSNAVPRGTVVSTGTGIMVPNEFALQPGDRVDIEIEGIGLLSNGVRALTD